MSEIEQMGYERLIQDVLHNQMEITTATTIARACAAEDKSRELVGELRNRLARLEAVEKAFKDFNENKITDGECWDICERAARTVRQPSNKQESTPHAATLRAVAEELRMTITIASPAFDYAVASALAAVASRLECRAINPAPRASDER